MKRRSFLKNASVAAGASAVYPVITGMSQPAGEKGIIELRVYHISRGGNNKGLLMDYFSKAYIPFLKKHNTKVFLFDEYSLEEPVKVYAVIGYPSASVYLNVQQAIWNDNDFVSASKSYNEIPSASPVFMRYETYLLEGFDRMPALIEPSPGTNAFEMRIYESANEDAGRKKIKMFNLEEIDLFLKFGLQPVFFGRILAGQYMPALIYMIALPDVASRDAIWAPFNTSPEWATLRVKPEYANVVSNIRRIFLTPVKLA
jgi:hypothetical protein